MHGKLKILPQNDRVIRYLVSLACQLHMAYAARFKLLREMCVNV
jgi:hypothetical protein